ncbi:arylsulfotransferase family protein [Fluviibacterium sp. DFM31]|uniref:Arylsulfotransferase family protein n=1 Tax=Meridianimarinicoccus marinus TaxID=3231483 RepID=A0ABV3L3G5_9RHOB
MSRIVSLLSALFLVGVLAFLGGMWTTHKDWAPWKMLNDTKQAVKSWRATGYVVPDGTYLRRPPRMPDDRYVVHQADKIAPGYLLINRIASPEPGYVTDLIDENGTVLHSWKIDHSKVIDDGSEMEFVHAVRPLPDGSVVANFDDAFGMARFDACGAPIWRRTDVVYHHSLTEDPDLGGFWTWTSKYWDGGHDQQMVRVDADTGETLESIDLVQDVLLPDPDALMAFRIPEHFRWNMEAKTDEIPDIIHPNDVEVLPAAWADAFPQFEAGDLIMSHRAIDLVGVVDRQTGKLKWHQAGPWEHQHDADFHPDGTITVYSNNTHRMRSTILEMDMTTGKVRDKFAGSGFEFDSYIMGQQERLPNGNWLVSAPMEGRVIELTAEGELVREISNVLSGDYNSIITTGVHVGPDFFDTLPSCSN